MAKKSRRARRQSSSVAQPIRIPQPARPQASQTAPREVDFAKEYSYVVEDLKRIAIIAASLFVLLIVLAIVIG
jgi:hypothetical protein